MLVKRLLYFVVGIFQFSNCEHGESVENYYNLKNGENVFRFRDFEPRFTNKAVVRKDNSSSRQFSQSPEREARGFQFHSNDNDLFVELEFTIPFIKIPVDRGLTLTRTAFRNLANLNTGALVWSGIIVAIGAVVATIVKVLSTAFMFSYRYKKTSRTTAIKDQVDFLHLMESKLNTNEIGITNCTQNLICNYMQRVDSDVRRGDESNIDQIVDGFTKLEVLEDYLRGTAFRHAIDAGKTSSSCENFFGSCRAQYFDNKIMKSVFGFLTNFVS